MTEQRIEKRYFQVYHFDYVADLPAPAAGQFAVITQTPDFGAAQILLITDGIKTIRQLYYGWRNSLQLNPQDMLNSIEAERQARIAADSAHAALTSAHGSASVPAAHRIAMYGAEGGLKSNKVPAEQNDAVRKAEMDAERQARENGDSGLAAAKLDKKPDGTNPLIGTDYKLNPQYLPAAVTGALVYGGTFSGEGIISASSYAPELQGVRIDSVNTGLYPGFYFVAGGTYAFGGSMFITGDWAISQGSHSPAWVKIDNGNTVSSVNGKTGTVTVTKADVGLGNVDNTPDTAKPVSAAQREAIDTEAGIRESADNALLLELQGLAGIYAPIDSPLFTGVPRVPVPDYTVPLQAVPVSELVYQLELLRDMLYDRRLIFERGIPLRPVYFAMERGSRKIKTERSVV